MTISGAEALKAWKEELDAKTECKGYINGLKSVMAGINSFAEGVSRLGGDFAAAQAQGVSKLNLILKKDCLPEAEKHEDLKPITDAIRAIYDGNEASHGSDHEPSYYHALHYELLL